MRIARFAVDADVSFGVVEGPDSDLVVAAFTGHPFGPFAFTGARYPLSAVRLLAPVLPSKIVGIGKNYADHIAEMGHIGGMGGGGAPVDPVVFLKPSTSVIGAGEAIRLPADSSRVDYEAELAVVVGRLCRDVPRERALDVVLGYTCANDVTARDQQAADGQWARGKGHDTFCPLGPWVQTDLDVRDLAVQCHLDGELRQDGRTAQLLHDVPAIIAWVTAFMTLLPGDVILTGTPAGVGPLAPGSSVAVTVEGIGTLTNPVLAR